MCFKAKEPFPDVVLPGSNTSTLLLQGLDHSASVPLDIKAGEKKTEGEREKEREMWLRQRSVCKCLRE